MSVTYCARVVCGFAVKKENRISTIKRFDEITGLPYSKSINGDPFASIQGVEFNKKESIAILEDEEIEGLFCYHTTDKYETVLGETISSLGNINYSTLLYPLETTIPEKVEKFAKKYNLKPQFYLVGRCS